MFPDTSASVTLIHTYALLLIKFKFKKLQLQEVVVLPPCSHYSYCHGFILCLSGLHTKLLYIYSPTTCSYQTRCEIKEIFCFIYICGPVECMAQDWLHPELSFRFRCYRFLWNKQLQSPLLEWLSLHDLKFVQRKKYVPSIKTPK